MPARHAPLLSLAAAASLLAVTAIAGADDLTVRTRELGDWNDALAALRLDPGSQGRTLHVQVLHGGEHVPCSRHHLTLDPATLRAFRPDPCDPRTDETAVTLTHRAALFDESSYVPMPRTLALSATLDAPPVGGPEAPSAETPRPGVFSASETRTASPPADAPSRAEAPPGTVWCRWGTERGKRGGTHCADSPYRAFIFAAVGAAGAIGAPFCFWASHAPTRNACVLLADGGGIMLASMGVGIYQATRPGKLLPVQPRVAITSSGATLGLAGAF